METDVGGKILSRACGPVVGSSSGAGVIKTKRRPTAATTAITRTQDFGAWCTALPSDSRKHSRWVPAFQLAIAGRPRTRAPQLLELRTFGLIQVGERQSHAVYVVGSRKSSNSAG